MRRSSVAAGAGLPTRRGTASKLCGWRKVGDAGPIPALEQAVRIAVRRRPVALRRRTRCPSRANEARQTDPLWIRRRWAETRRDLVLRLWRAVRSTIRPASVRHRTSGPSSGTAPRPAARLDPQHAYQIAFSIMPRAARIEPTTTSLSPYRANDTPPAQQRNSNTLRGVRERGRNTSQSGTIAPRSLAIPVAVARCGQGFRTHKRARLGLSVSSRLFCPFYPCSASWHKPEAQPPRSLLEDEPAACDPVCAHDGVPEAT
jgi:hypothetical protein